MLIGGHRLTSRAYPSAVTMDDPDWGSILQALDEPVPRRAGPSVEAILRPVDGQPGKYTVMESEALALIEQFAPPPGQGGGLEVPRNFDHAATQGRFDRLVERLSEAYGWPCTAGRPQDSTCFGIIVIPAEATRTRAKRTRTPTSVAVLISNFGGLATYVPQTRVDEVAPVHPEDRQRIEEALRGLGYLVVPERVLAAPYDGPNVWAFGPTTNVTWFGRFFDHI
jgi:hypothetical protein